MGLGRNWYTNWTKTCYIPKVSKFYVKRIFMLTGLNSRYHIWHVNVSFTNHNIMQRRLLKGLEMQK